MIISHTACFANHKALFITAFLFLKEEPTEYSSRGKGSVIILKDTAKWSANTGGNKLQPQAKSRLWIAHEPRMAFTFLNGGRKIKRTVFRDMWNMKFRFWCLPWSFWGHSYSHLFTCGLCCFHAITHNLQSPKYWFWLFSETGVLTPGFRKECHWLGIGNWGWGVAQKDWWKRDFLVNLSVQRTSEVEEAGFIFISERMWIYKVGLAVGFPTEDLG